MINKISHINNSKIFCNKTKKTKEINTIYNKNNAKNIYYLTYSPKIIFRGKPYTPSDDFEEVTKENIDKLVPLYRGYQEGMNQTVDKNKLKNFINTVLNDNHKIFLINKDGESKGFAHFSTTYSTIDMCPFTTIQSVYVKKEDRGKGYAKQLIEEIKKWTEFNNYKGVFVKTHANNKSSMALYEKLNFHNESAKYGSFFWANEKILDYKKGYVNTKK